MDEYRIDTKELWYYILYPICFIIVVLVAWGFEALIVSALHYFVPSINIQNDLFIHGIAIGILVGIILSIILIIELKTNIPWSKLNGFAFLQYISAIGLVTVLYIVIVNFNTYFYPPRQSNGTTYEPFTDGTNMNQTLKKVRQITRALQKSLDTLSTANDDTCSVMKGIEKRFLDNATAPDGEEDVSPAEAKEIKARKIPVAKKQWAQKKQDWSATHEKIAMIECFADESVNELVEANEQLSDLLDSTPVQRVVAKIKSIQTSASFSQFYIDQLVEELTKESFANLNATPEATIATSNKLIAKANDVQLSISKILDSTRILKKNYASINAKSNDPTTITNMAGINVVF